MNTASSVLSRRVKYHQRCLTFLRTNTKHAVNLLGTQKVEIQLSNGRTFNISTGKLAKMADGCCVGKSGETSVMVTAVSKTTASPGASFLPLTVDYRQKAAAAGRIPTNFLRREMGPSDKEILTSRMIDRSLRPLFPAGYYYDTQLMCNLLAVDSVNDPDVLSINTASAALAVSDIPFPEIVGAVRIGLVEDEVIVNPTRREMSKSKLDLLVAGTDKSHILMIEGAASEPVLLNGLLKCIKQATKELYTIVRGIKLLQHSNGKPKRLVERYFVPCSELIQEASSLSKDKLVAVFSNFTYNKLSRDAELQVIRSQTIEKLKEKFQSEDSSIINEAWNKAMKQTYANHVTESGFRCDGRSFSQIRPMTCDVDLYKPLHGSALFQRGQTQVLCSVALDSLNSVLRADPVTVLTGGIKEKNFMLHYEFPPYATNEVGRNTYGRRELGHGALAEKSLRPLLPEKFPFTTRLSCEVLESNGSSSMASVCAGSMAMMDAGVPISDAAAGVAMGILATKTGTEQQYQILTDIMGMEDYLGEMDFKIAGTMKAFTALQLDCKLAGGLPNKVIMEALQKAHDAKIVILKKMSEAINEVRAEKKQNWPISSTLNIPANKRGTFIGIGGQNLKRLLSETGVQITQDPEDPTNYLIFAPNKEALDEANEFIQDILISENKGIKVPEFDFGGIYTCKIVEIRDNGVMVLLHPNMSPVMLHLKELDQRKVFHTSALNLEVGQELQVKYFGRDPVTGHLRISRRILQMMNPKSQNFLDKEEEKPVLEEKESSNGNS